MFCRYYFLQFVQIVLSAGLSYNFLLAALLNFITAVYFNLRLILGGDVGTKINNVNSIDYSEDVFQNLIASFLFQILAVYFFKHNNRKAFFASYQNKKVS